MLKLGSIDIRLSDGTEFTIGIQDCDANGEAIKDPTDEWTETERMAYRAARKEQQENDRSYRRASEQERKVLLGLDLPVNRLNCLLEEGELEGDKNQLSAQILEAVQGEPCELSFNQPINKSYGYYQNSLMCYIQFPAGVTPDYIASLPWHLVKFPHLQNVQSNRVPMTWMPKGVRDKLGLSSCCYRKLDACERESGLSPTCPIRQAAFQPFGSGKAPGPPADRSTQRRKRQASEVSSSADDVARFMVSQKQRRQLDIDEKRKKMTEDAVKERLLKCCEPYQRGEVHPPDTLFV
jgi:hypothetical protein